VAETLDAAGRAREAVDEAVPGTRPAPPAATDIGAAGLLDSLRRGVRAQGAFVRALDLYKHRQYREAAALFAEAVEFEPSFDEAWAALGWSGYFAADYATAIAAFGIALQRQPTWGGLYDGLGWSRLRLGRLHLARDAFKTALELSPDYADAQIGLGEAYFRLGEDDRALAAFTAAERRLRPVVGADPVELAEVRVRLAWTLYHLERFPEAIEAFVLAIRGRPADHELHLGLGWTYLKVGRKAEARAAFERVLALRPGYRDAERGLARTR
jgi:protein O-GlcNAc transferase